jgi:hypothetical protein
LIVSILPSKPLEPVIHITLVSPATRQ